MTSTAINTRLGRPPALPPTYTELGERLKAALGASDKEVAEVFGVNLSTWQRMRRRAAAAAAASRQKGNPPVSGGAAPVPVPLPHVRLARELRRIASQISTGSAL